MSTYIDALAWLPKCFMSYVDGVNVWPLVSGIITLFKAPSYLVFAINKHLSACMLAMNSTFVMLKCLVLRYVSPLFANTGFEWQHQSPVCLL